MAAVERHPWLKMAMASRDRRQDPVCSPSYTRATTLTRILNVVYQSECIFFDGKLPYKPRRGAAAT